MRLIGSVCRRANLGLSRRFQRCQDTEISSACLHSVVNETSNVVLGSNILGHDRSYSASPSAFAESSVLEDRKPRKRISKSERRTLVENYVNKYRETNEGKFPTASHTVNNVGGSYYVARQIIQEMIYNSKQSSIISKDTSLEKSAIKTHEMICNSREQSMYTKDTSLEKSSMKVDEITPKFKGVPQTREVGKGTRTILKNCENSSSMTIQSKQGQQSSVSVETNEPRDVGLQSNHPIDKPESSRNLDHEKDVKQEILEDHVKPNALEHKSGPQEPTGISGRRLQEVRSEDAESQKKSSVWNNLKSFANEIMSLWRS
ncbi:hypothetical protein C2S51_003546 [Perilla frutescens var. frutescens]|nr:hypothetical protein C2S51_003546 [Perilla frutescens var. frutescens]